MSKDVIAFIVGTRPEAIKTAPLILETRKSDLVEPFVIDTGQHNDAVGDLLSEFGITSDLRINLNRVSGTLSELSALLTTHLSEAISLLNPKLVLVQGDTLSAYVGAHVSVLLQIPVAHLEAGLRSFDCRNPFPEEFNRRAIAQFADLHFAPTTRAVNNLLREGIDSNAISNVGNTVVDAMEILKFSLATQTVNSQPRWLITMHRRENWGAPMINVANKIKDFCKANPLMQVIWVLHPNPKIASEVSDLLEGTPNVLLSEPLSYKSMLIEQLSSNLILTDSGGIQEEAPSFRKPVVVLRNQTERKEGVESGIALLMDPNNFDLEQVLNFELNNPYSKDKVNNVTNPYGDGLTAHRCTKIMEQYCELRIS
jgi:UDP-N-acetylglucosamine 2-epimerase (non-hydrolysing)